MKKRLQLRQYFENVFNYVKLLKNFVTSNDTERNSHLSLSLSRANVFDQSIQSIVNVMIESNVEFENDNEKISTKDFNENNTAFENWMISNTTYNNWNDS
jgi:hypothetical protein